MFTVHVPEEPVEHSRLDVAVKTLTLLLVEKMTLQSLRYGLMMSDLFTFWF